MHTQTGKRGMFVTADGKNVLFTFILVTTLFFLWGFCNGMIDTMDKHFQLVLNLDLTQSAWVQFAHYLGYFLMALPAGFLASKLGYKGGIIAGLLLVAAGGLWFIPASHIQQFWAFLLGVCVVAAGLTFLETVANPYTTVLGDQQYGATRINLAQSFNGIGSLCGPIAGGYFFYSKSATGADTGSQTLYIPYVAVAVVVILLSVAFFFANVPDIQTEDDYSMDKAGSSNFGAPREERVINRPLVYVLLLLNTLIMIGVIDIILVLISSVLGSWLKISFLADIDALTHWGIGAGIVAAVVAVVVLGKRVKNISHYNIWSHPHFSAATLAQFFYVAAQAGIFSFFINYLTGSNHRPPQVPALPMEWAHGIFGWAFRMNEWGKLQISETAGAFMLTAGQFCFLSGRFSGAYFLKVNPAHKMLGLYGLINGVVCMLIFMKLGWISVVCVFLSYFFMSIMFPTIFALGIHGLGVQSKKASAFIVMAIMGGALLPKLMGYVGDKFDLSRGFIVPAFCFAVVSYYGYSWAKLAGREGLAGTVGVES
jgi:FHS family L-fucose permease-like MFS transporter